MVIQFNGCREVAVRQQIGGQIPLGPMVFL